MDKLSELAAAMTEAAIKETELRRAKDEERNQLIREIDKQLAEKHNAGIAAAAHVRWEAEDAYYAENERLALEAAGGKLPYPLGTKLYEWAIKGSYARQGFGRVHKNHQTGRLGLVEVATRNMVIPNGITYSKPHVGEIIIRLLKKDGSLSKCFEEPVLWKRWLPEGQEPKEREE